MSVRNLYPQQRPTLNLNFAQSKILDPRITFTRTSTATRTNELGLVEVVPTNAPRFDHRYENGVVKSLGLLVEESRQNFLLRSEDFTTTWTNFNSTDASNTAIAPNGTTTADTLISNVGVTDGLLRQDVSGLADNTTYTLSVFLKTAGLVSVSLQFYNKANTFHGSKTLNLSTGILSGSDFVGTSSVVSYGNGWYRLILTNLGSGTGATTPNVRIISLSTGDGTSGIYIWGAQLEAGSFATSYIPTGASTVTRNPDNVSMTGENFLDWYNPTEGTVYADTRMVGVQTGRYDRLWAITNSNLNLEGISIFVAGPAGVSGGYVSSITITNSATEQIGGTLVESAITTPNLRSAFAFKQNDCASAYNRQQRFVDSIVDLSSFTTPLDRLLIGQPQRFQGYSCMTISKLTYYPVRLTNTQLQSLTK